MFYNRAMDTLKEYKSNGIYLKHALTSSPLDSSFPMHIHHSYEIYLFIRGNVKYLVEGSSYDLLPGSVLIIRPSESHKPKILGTVPYERYNINFKESNIRSLDPQLKLLTPFLNRELGHSNLFTPSELEDIPIQKLFYDMCYSQKDTYGKHLKIMTNLLFILDALHHAYDSRGKIPPLPRSREEQIVAFVNERLNTELSIPKIAEQFYLSPSQFSRIFKSATGASPWEYITIKRLSYARDLIRSGNSPSEAFSKCGYGDYSAFYRAYIRHFGISPMEEKKRQ